MAREAAELQVLTAFGRTLDTAVVLGVQPEEWQESEGRGNRTFVLRIEGAEARISEVLPDPVSQSWLSGGGTAYCPTRGGFVLKHREGRWERERACDRDEEFGAVLGFSGTDEAQDVVLVCGERSLFVRSGGLWREVPLPEDAEETMGLHGLAPDEVYVATDAGLLLWDGSGFSEVEGPEDEPLGLLVLGDDRLLAVGDTVSLWAGEDGWEDLESPVDSHAGSLARLGDDIYIPSLDGVLRLRDGAFEVVLEVASNYLVQVGDGLLAAGADGGLHRFDGSAWAPVALPRLAPGEKV